MLQYLESPDDDVSSAFINELKHATTALAKALDIHNLIPMALGAKAKGLVEVLAAYFFSLFHRCHDITQLEHVCDRIYVRMPKCCIHWSTFYNVCEALEM